MKNRIAFVCQRYGLEVNGGAETECRAYAEHMLKYYDVTVLTTCSLEYTEWDNYYPGGATNINGVNVIRFVNSKGRNPKWAKIDSKMKQGPISRWEEKEWVIAQGPVCENLAEYIKTHYTEYKGILFMTYLYYTTVCGMTQGMNNAILIPTAHNEPAIYLNIYRDMFLRARGFIYNTIEEKQFVETIFPMLKSSISCIAGFGIDEYVESENLASKENYIVYAGRIATGKGCSELFQYFQRYKHDNDSPVKLLLMGKREMNIPNDKDIVYLGFVDETKKKQVIRDAKALVLASTNESFSIVSIEALMMGTPILVNSECSVLKGHCERSNAGLYFKNYTEFALTLNYLFEHEHAYEVMRNNGKLYAKNNYSWAVIETKIKSVIEEVEKSMCR